MRFLFRKTIEISTEVELPVSGYDIKKASEMITKSEFDYVLKEAIFDSRSHQTHTVGTRVYEVEKKDTLISLQYGGPSIDELNDPQKETLKEMIQNDEQLGLYD